MPLYEMNDDEFEKIKEISFDMHNIKEKNIQKRLKEQIEVIDDGILIIAEEFRNWEDSRRRIDLLGIDKEGNIVVIELKRDTDGGYMELQAIRYAAMISTISFQQAVEIYQDYLRSEGDEDTDAEQAILDFLEWDKIYEDLFAQDIKIILISAGFSNELITSVLWLNERNLDIKCVRMKPYEYECCDEKKKILVDFQTAIPLPGAEDYFIGIRKKNAERVARERGYDSSTFNILVGEEALNTEPLSKRKTMLTLVKFLVDEKGVHPDEIMEYMPGGKGGVAMLDLGESINPEEVHQRVNDYLKDGGRKEVNPARRYNTNPEQIIQYGGRIYVLTNQWSGGVDNNKFSATKKKLMDGFADKFNIKVEPSRTFRTQDRTKFNIFVGEEEKCLNAKPLPKNATMLTLIKFLVNEKGVHPDKIKACLPGKGGDMIYLGENIKSEDARQKLEDYLIKQGLTVKYIDTDYYWKSEQLIQYDNKTYVLRTTCWVVDAFKNTLKKLMDEFGEEYKICVNPCES